MNLPNALTISRIFLTVFLVFFLLQKSLVGDILAMVVFAAAALTDFYDGFLAKTMGVVSDFGKIMDPIADKILILSAFFVLAHLRLLPWWMVIVIAVREVLVTISRLIAMRQGQVLAAERAGKVKTVVQIVVVLSSLIYLPASQSSYCPSWVLGLWLHFLNFGLMAFAVVMTLYSGIEYFRNKR